MKWIPSRSDTEYQGEMVRTIGVSFFSFGTAFHSPNLVAVELSLG